MVVLIDNYDSFTYNLVQAVGALLRGAEGIRVYRNDQVTVDEIEAVGPTRLILSPGPCTPRESGITVEALRRFAGRVPILGVCLGHQCIAAAFGATVNRADRIMHGKTTAIRHDGRTIFRGLSDGFTATRYHSLIVRRETLPDAFDVSAWTDAGEVMGLRHASLRLEGVQFHPESYLTNEGERLIANYLAMA